MSVISLLDSARRTSFCILFVYFYLYTVYWLAFCHASYKIKCMNE